MWTPPTFRCTDSRRAVSFTAPLSAGAAPGGERRTIRVRRSGGGAADTEWDAHSDIEKNHIKMAGLTDKPVTALVKDLKRRGLLEGSPQHRVFDVGGRRRIQRRHGLRRYGWDWAEG